MELTDMSRSDDARVAGPNGLPEMPEAHQMTGTQKAATLLMALGIDAAGGVLREMSDDHVEKVSVEIAQMRNATSDMIETALLEYRDMSMAQEHIAEGGMGFARKALGEALGSDKAEDVMMQVEAAMEVSAFHLLQTVETSQLTNFLQGEHPQTAALILAHLNARKSAEIVSTLPEEQQCEILFRLATMGKTSPELLSDIEEVIRDQLGSVFGADLSATGGVEQVAEILNSASRSTEGTVLDNIQERSGDVAASIKQHMFIFEDLVNISDRDMQRLLTKVDQSNLVLSLKAASEGLKDKILRNVSDRVAETVREELELMGRVRVRDVDEAQHAILKVAQELEEQDEIVLSRGGDDDAFI